MVRFSIPTPQELEESYTYKDHRIKKISVFESHMTKCNFIFTKRWAFRKVTGAFLQAFHFLKCSPLCFFSHGIQQSHSTFFFLLLFMLGS
jgi:hypothetical protein